MGNELRKKQLDEAIIRLGLLGLDGEVTERFREGIYTMYDSFSSDKALVADTFTRQMVKDFEEKYNAVVYLVIRNWMPIGVMDSLFYVSSYTEEWEMDKEDLKAGFPVVYVDNLTNEMLSEFGMIMIKKTKSGGIIRVG